MDNHPTESYWIPVLLTVAAFFAEWGAPAILKSPTEQVVLTCRIVAVVLLVVAGALAYRSQRQRSLRGGGRGGSAQVRGHDSEAVGGAGGRSSSGGLAGDGGSACVKGNRSRARGGAGGGA